MITPLEITFLYEAGRRARAPSSWPRTRVRRAWPRASRAATRR